MLNDHRLSSLYSSTTSSVSGNTNTNRYSSSIYSQSIPASSRYGLTSASTGLGSLHYAHHYQPSTSSTSSSLYSKPNYRHQAHLSQSMLMAHNIVGSSTSSNSHHSYHHPSSSLSSSSSTRSPYVDSTVATTAAQNRDSSSYRSSYTKPFSTSSSSVVTSSPSPSSSISYSSSSLLPSTASSSNYTLSSRINASEHPHAGNAMRFMSNSSNVPSTTPSSFNSTATTTTPVVSRTSSPTTRSSAYNSSTYTNYRLRERPLLSQLAKTVRTSGVISSSGNSLLPPKASNSSSRTSSVSSSDQHPDSWSRDLTRNISRNKYMIKFREAHIDEPIERRKASITWDLTQDLSNLRLSSNLGSDADTISDKFTPISEESQEEESPISISMRVPLKTEQSLPLEKLLSRSSATKPNIMLSNHRPLAHQLTTTTKTTTNSTCTFEHNIAENKLNNNNNHNIISSNDFVNEEFCNYVADKPIVRNKEDVDEPKKKAVKKPLKIKLKPVKQSVESEKHQDDNNNTAKITAFGDNENAQGTLVSGVKKIKKQAIKLVSDSGSASAIDTKPIKKVKKKLANATDTDVNAACSTIVDDDTCRQPQVTPKAVETTATLTEATVIPTTTLVVADKQQQIKSGEQLRSDTRLGINKKSTATAVEDDVKRCEDLNVNSKKTFHDQKRSNEALTSVNDINTGADITDIDITGGNESCVSGATNTTDIAKKATKIKKTKPKTSAKVTKKKVSGTKTKGRVKFRHYCLDDFNFLSLLGQGGWGCVFLAELKDHDLYFAVKCIKKYTIQMDDDIESIIIERKVLTLGNIHPFICKLFCTFENDAYLFFVMEYCAGGDLMFHVQKEKKFSEDRCRFYAAEIVCAIKFLHDRLITYRDLKLDNILLDSKGHIRLVDFGMCQYRSYREELLPSNFCGTPEYISPEIIAGKPYNHSVDWWSFGVLLYEMATGKMPFRGSDENELLWNVCNETIHYPCFLSPELTSLLQLLLERDPVKRLGMPTCPAGDIHDQPWFRDINWKKIEALKVPPPFVPEVRSPKDVQNFDSDFTESAPELSPVEPSILDEIKQDLFAGFSYTNPELV
ncbi:putative protein kinase C delta type-like protein, partial [Fragariocoptes setiger]